MTGKIVSLAISSIAALAPLGAQAQEGQYRLQDATQLWRLTENAATLQLDSSVNRGYAEFQAEHRSGDYRRVQEGGQRNQLAFETERYQSIGKYLVGYGRFRFDMNRTKDRAWADVMRPYNATPFFSGSSVRGKYDTQQFDLSAALGTTNFGGFRFGARLDYKVGDLSRLRDPRSRSELLQYRITPAVAYTIGAYTLSFAGHYDRRKEKIPNMTTVQTDPNLKYYQMTGMEHAAGLVGGYNGYSREWVNHQMGAELGFGYRNGALCSVTTAGIVRSVEDVLGQYKYQPGRYTSYTYKAASHNRIDRGALLHEIDLDVNINEGYADEFRQQLIQERDAERGFTSYRYETQIEFKKRYQVRVTDAALRYRLNTVSQGAVTGYVGMGYSLRHVKNRHLLPQSQLGYDHFLLKADGGKSLLRQRLWIDLSIGYHFAKNADLQLAAPNAEYAMEVLQPDMAYYRANYWQGRVDVKYLFPLSIKGNRSTAYVRAYADILRTNNSLDRKAIGLTVGFYN
ncbi:MAG: hypothetical protein K6G08_07210 [Prevotella sp.]|nr:hypothetical protein [Prevotella sp.]